MNLGDISLQQLMDALAKGGPSMAPARLKEPGLLLPAPAPALPQKYQDMSSKDCRERLRELQDEIVKDVSKGRFSDAESREWQAIPEKHRALLLLMSGFQADDYEQLGIAATRAWQEFTPPERQAIKAELRELHSAIQRVTSLRSKT